MRTNHNASGKPSLEGCVGLRYPLRWVLQATYPWVCGILTKQFFFIHFSLFLSLFLYPVSYLICRILQGRKKEKTGRQHAFSIHFFVFFAFGNSEFGIWISTTRASIISFLTEGKLFFVLFICELPASKEADFRGRQSKDTGFEPAGSLFSCLTG